MRKIFAMFFIIVFCVGHTRAVPAFSHEKTKPAQADAHQWTALNYGLIAHGGGGIDGRDTTNTYDAMAANYEAGHRVFEFDLNLTSDERLAAVHDWSLYNGVKTLEEYKNIKIYGKYTSMGLDDIYRFMTLHKDVWIVTDTKSFQYSPERAALQFRIIRDTALNNKDYGPELLNRVIPQIYDRAMYDTVTAVYPFRSIIYTLYASTDSDMEVLDFVKDKADIKAVTMAPGRYSRAFNTSLARRGKLVYLHTLNDPAEVAAYREQGVHGFYTDFITGL